MNKDSKSTEKTSRRHFTKAVVTAAVVAPIAASLASSTNETPGAQDKKPVPRATPPVVRESSDKPGHKHHENTPPPIEIQDGSLAVFASTARTIVTHQILSMKLLRQMSTNITRTSAAQAI